MNRPEDLRLNVRRFGMGLVSLLVSLLAALPSNAQGSESATEDWPQVLPGHALDYPRDHGAHPAFRTEWWYLTGNVEDAEGRPFGFQFTIFRSALAPGAPDPAESPLRARQVFAGHLAVTDIRSESTSFAERMRRASPLASASTDDLDVVLEDWSLVRGAEDVLSVSAADPSTGIALRLELRPEKPFVLHGEGGVSAKGGAAGNASAYQSWTRLAVSGELAAPGVEAREIAGQAWFDHEFGSSVLGEGVSGWDWFGLHLADGRDLMLFELRGDGPERSAAGTLVDAAGRATPLGRADFELESNRTWNSPRTGARYPAAWRLQLPEHGIDLTVVPRVADAEIPAELLGVTYWEGPVVLKDFGTGTAAGTGYVELTGYSGTMAGRF